MIRLTGGIHRGRVLMTPRHQRTRPTQVKLRQAWFNSLQAQIPGSRFLDLFAGSGALGFEALSRGADQVLFVERDRVAAQLIQKNGENLNLQGSFRILVESVESVLAQLVSQGPFDLILADPPYSGGWETKLLTTWPWETLLAPSGYFCLEWGLNESGLSTLPDQLTSLVKVREKNYGDSVLTHYQRCMS